MLISLPLVTALVAGFAHALEADHMAAVTTFVSRRPHPLRAVGFGVRWGLGHSAAILALGAVLIVLDVRLPEGLARGLEFGVGAMLLGLGLWLLYGVLRRDGAAHHGHAHGHAAHGHPHGAATTWVGVAHGLAGTAALLALLPVTLLASPWMAGGYLILFGVGTVAAMALYAGIAGLLFHHAAGRFPAIAVGLRALTALASALIGVFWMYGAALGA